LAISRAIVERSGGTLTARNQDGRGASFSIVIPVSTSKKRATRKWMSRSFLLNEEERKRYPISKADVKM